MIAKIKSIIGYYLWKVGWRILTNPTPGFHVLCRVDYPENIKLGDNGRLIQEVFIPYHIAVLGGNVPLRTFEGTTIKVKIPPLAQGQMIKIKNKGLYNGNVLNERSDLFLVPKIKLPDSISEKHKTILEELAKLYDQEENNNL